MNKISPDKGPLGSTDTTAKLTIDLAAVGANYDHIGSLLAKGVECAAVVKANAYGTGAHRVAPYLYQQKGCRSFFVATIMEGIQLRSLLPNAKIYILDGLFPGSAAFFLEHKLIPVLGSLEMLGEWGAIGASQSKTVEAALHIDTGMNRLGLGSDTLFHLIEHQTDLLENIKLDLIMSHLACADDPEHPRNKQQLEMLRAALDSLPPARVSMANSAGCFLGKDYHFDLVRPGISLYGGAAVNGTPNPMRPVVHLTSHIAQIREVKQGDTVGYGAVYKMERKSRVGTIPVGYADGYCRTLGSTNDQNGACAFVEGHKVPLIGRVSMDLITVDLTDLPDHLIIPGTPVELLGSQVTVDDLAQIAGTIGYEILTSLGHRYARNYVEA